MTKSKNGVGRKKKVETVQIEYKMSHLVIEEISERMEITYKEAKKFIGRELSECIDVKLMELMKGKKQK